jgi:hypothetical protein
MLKNDNVTYTFDRQATYSKSRSLPGSYPQSDKEKDSNNSNIDITKSQDKRTILLSSSSNTSSSNSTHIPKFYKKVGRESAATKKNS